MKSQLKRISLSNLILAGLVLGVACGLFLGEYAAALSVVGEAYIALLQMTVLPYITIALVANIGRLSPSEGKRFGVYAGGFLLLSLLLALGTITLLSQMLPERLSASFFSSSELKEAATIDFVRLFIPSNPFYALANNVVPAVVLFCTAIGLAIMALEEKGEALKQLDFLTDALATINRQLVRLTPLGVFAIVASLAGTIHLDELNRLEAYLVINTVAALVLAYGVLLVLLAALTPFSYGELFRASRTAVLTAFITAKVFIVLPMLASSAEELFKQRLREPDDASTYVRAVTPLAYPFPHAGKLLALLFIPFTAWFVDEPLRLSQYPSFLGAGLFSLFGSPMVAIPFLLDMFRLPADMIQLFIASGVVTGRLGDLLGAIHIFFVSVLTACALSGNLRLRIPQLMRSLFFIAGICTVATIGARTYLASSLDTEYTRDQVVRNMHGATAPYPAVVHRVVPPPLDGSESSLQRITNGGVLRVGYHPDNLPYSFFNARDELVGYDIDMANHLARQFQCQLEFVPFTFATLSEQLNRGDFDIAMSGITMFPSRLTQMRFPRSISTVTAALIVPDHRREEISRMMDRHDFTGITLATARSDDASTIASTLLPGAEFTTLGSLREYLESGGKGADGMVWAAESGSAWTLLYPNFSRVLIRPLFQVPTSYPMALNNTELEGIISQWLGVIQVGPFDEQLYDHWILGKSADKRGKRWSMIRNVLGWVD